MSEHGDLHIGPDGFLDMSQFDATDPDTALDPHAYDQLHHAIVNAHAPVPGSRLFDSWIQTALDQAHHGPDTSGLVPGVAEGHEPQDDLPAQDEPGWSDQHDPPSPSEDSSHGPHPPDDHPHDDGHSPDHV